MLNRKWDKTDANGDKEAGWNWWKYWLTKKPVETDENVDQEAG